MTCTHNCNQGRACACATVTPEGYLMPRQDGTVAPLDRWTIVFLLLSGFLSGALVTVLCFAAGVSHG